MIRVGARSLLGGAVVLLALVSSVPQIAGRDFTVVAPEAHGFSSPKLAEVINDVGAAHVPIHSITLLRGGDVLLNANFYPFEGGLHDVASVTKSVTTTLIGIAAGEGKLDLDAPMLSFFPDRTIRNRDARKEAITVRQLTQNLSGLDCIGAPEEVTLAKMEASSNSLQFALDLPMAHDPGTHFDYCSPGMHILSAILQEATGVTEFAYAQQKLFAPLGISDAVWDTDAQGFTRGWGDLHLTPLDMARLGTLWLHRGAWDGRQIIPADWLQSATTHARPTGQHEDYGAGFWVGPSSEPISYFFATGRGGQRIVVAPPLDLVLVTTAGGIDPGTVIDPLLTALADPAKPLSPDAAGEAALAATIDQIAKGPAAQPVAPLPPVVAEISGETFRFGSNANGIESVKLEFSGDAVATMTLTVGGTSVARPVGLDGAYRFSPGEHGIPLGVRGEWQDAETFVIDYDTIGKIRRYVITARFAGDELQMTIAQQDEPTTVTLTGRAGQ